MGAGVCNQGIPIINLGEETKRLQQEQKYRSKYQEARKEKWLEIGDHSCGQILLGAQANIHTYFFKQRSHWVWPLGDDGVSPTMEH
jgi:hypothetical protein